MDRADVVCLMCEEGFNNKVTLTDGTESKNNIIDVDGKYYLSSDRNTEIFNCPICGRKLGE